MTTNKAYRNEMTQWVEQHSQDDWRGWYSLTLTMKQYIRGKSEHRTGTFKFNLDEVEASQSMRYFLNRLNKSILGNAFSRNGNRLKVVPIFEYDRNKHLHYHLLIKVPDHITETQLRGLVLSNWMKTKWGLWQMDIQETYSSGWLHYITKDTTRDFANIDLFNTTLTP
jgi:hypothetical protein